LEQTGDATEFGLHPHGSDDSATGSRGYARSHKNHVPAIAPRRVALIQSDGALADSLGFASQRVFGALERSHLNRPGVSRREVSNFMLEDVAWNDLNRRSHVHMPVTPDLAPGAVIFFREAMASSALYFWYNPIMALTMTAPMITAPSFHSPDGSEMKPAAIRTSPRDS
jgi:hypothetical protein